MTAIEFENISKQYRLGLVSTGTLSHDLNRFIYKLHGYRNIFFFLYHKVRESFAGMWYL